MSNIRIVAVNEGDDATLTSDSEALSVSNLQILGRTKVWRTISGTTSAFINGSWDSGSVVNSLVLYRNNFTSTATFRVRFWDGADQTGNIVYDSGTIDAFNKKGWGDFVWGVDSWGSTLFTGWESRFTQLFFDSVTAKSFQIDIDDSENDYLEVERLIIGYYFEPTVGMAYGASLQWQESTEFTRTAGGTLRSDGSKPFRVLSFELNHLSEPERTRMQEIQRQVGKRKDVFVSAREDASGALERDWAMLAKFQEHGPLTAEYHQHYATSITLEET